MTISASTASLEDSEETHERAAGAAAPALGGAKEASPGGASRPGHKDKKKLFDSSRQMSSSRHIIQHSWFPALDPRSRFMRDWDAVVGLMLVYTAFVTPFEVAFIDVRTFNFYAKTAHPIYLHHYPSVTSIMHRRSPLHGACI